MGHSNFSPTPVDEIVERFLRRVAQRSSRRSFVKRLGVFLVGAAALPLLPVSRGMAADEIPDDDLIKGDGGDPESCNYWRYCGIDGNPCACCGGSVNSCPPGTELSPIGWVGTCRNPIDDKDYVVAYYDCCGTTSCGRCFCTRNEGDRPVYVPAKNNDIVWCFGTSSNTYHCTMASVIDIAD
jgi:methylamine dehydrogenase light chain